MRSTELSEKRSSAVGDFGAPTKATSDTIALLATALPLPKFDIFPRCPHSASRTRFRRLVQRRESKPKMRRTRHLVAEPAFISPSQDEFQRTS